jgi:hypothetical protein
VKELEYLSPAQRGALDYLTEYALRRRSVAGADLASALEANSVPGTAYSAAIENLRTQGKVVVAFHPERLTRTGRSVAEGLLADGVYKNQFETGLSSGATSAFSGGERDQWERRLFGGAYHAPDVHWPDRPKYGALFLVAHPDGPCPRFGSSYFVLRPEVSRRCSFTLLGSQEDSALEQTGTFDAPEPWLASLVRHLDTYPTPLGLRGLTPHDLFRRMSLGVPIVPEQTAADPNGRALDTFVEAQIHGPIMLRRDIEALVVDSSFYSTSVAATLSDLSSTYDIPMRWHPGFTLRADEFPESFRGFPTRCIAERVAADGIVDAPSLGAGQNDFVQNPSSWQELGSWSDALTSFRRVWHFLVLLGRPSRHWRELSVR